MENRRMLEKSTAENTWLQYNLFRMEENIVWLEKRETVKDIIIRELKNNAKRLNDELAYS